MPTPRPLIASIATAVGLACGGTLDTSATAQDAQGPSSTPTMVTQLPAEPEGLAEVLQAPATDARTRQAAATALVGLGDSGRANALLRDLLKADSPKGLRRLLALEIAQLTSPPRGLVPALAAGLDPTNEESTLAVLAALARYHGRDAAWPIIMLLERTDLPRTISEAAFDALIGQTGRADLGRSAGPWRQWWQEVQKLSDAAWKQAVVDGLAGRAAELAAERDRVSRRLTDALRRLHAATPEEGREELIIELLGGDVAECRRLGLDLVNRAQLNARPVSERVAAAVTHRLTDTLADARASAATIIGRLDRPDLLAPVLHAFESESDPGASAAMLRALARGPSREMLEPALRWLDGPAPADLASIEALLAAEAANLLTDPEQARRVRRALDERFPDRLSATVLRLLVQLGGEERVLGLLRSEDRGIALAAAEAVSDRPGAVDTLVGAAMENPALFDVATAALARFRPTAEGYALAAALPAPSAQQREAALARAARSLPPPDLLAVASAEKDARIQEACLAHVGSQEFFAGTDAPGARGLLATLLARARLALRRPDEALAALDAVPEAMRTPSMAVVRAGALVCSGKLEEAEAVREPAPEIADAWLEALEFCVDDTQKASVREAIESGFAGALNAAQAERFVRLGGRPPAGPP